MSEAASLMAVQHRKVCDECGCPFDPDSENRQVCILLVKLRDGVGLFYAVCGDCFDHFDSGNGHYLELSPEGREFTAVDCPKITADALGIAERLVLALRPQEETTLN